MDAAFEIRDLSLASSSFRKKVEQFLGQADLNLDPALKRISAIYDNDENLLGCAGLDGDIIKCLALSESLRGEGVAASLITHLTNMAFANGVINLRVFTKPQYEDLFTSLGFTVIGRTNLAILLESDSSELKRYKNYLASLHCDGVIVANANPCTKGHLYLIEQAAKVAERLAVIPVADHASNMFSYDERVAMLKAATAHIDNVVIAQGSDYAVSSATFPSYFIKEASDVARTHAELDLDVFCRHIAPAAGFKMRFIGTEPNCALTADYNALMKQTLQSNGIAVVEIERKEQMGSVISATSVRKALSDGNLAEALSLTPKSDLPWLLSKLALSALHTELALTPKPGLVDPSDSGSHKDMDYLLMCKGIDALADYFVSLALDAQAGKVSASQLKQRGLDGERAMFEATGGVNTHRGAVFALGLAVTATALILSGYSDADLQTEISRLASLLDYAKGTHGEEVRKAAGTKGALDVARQGYPLLFQQWLPFLQVNAKDEYCLHKLLLKIITEIDDSNACYRAGKEGADKAARMAKQAFDNFSIEMLSALNDEYKAMNVSHGGAADMLSLTIFIRSLLPTL